MRMHTRTNHTGACVVCGRKAKEAGGKIPRGFMLQTCGRKDCVKHARLHSWRYEKTVDTAVMRKNMDAAIERDRLLAIRDKFVTGRKS